jgi:isoleucyl-tRNA synthetase
VGYARVADRSGAEKELQFEQKSDIEKYGVANFNRKAKDFVYHHIEYAEGWQKLTERMGYWINLDNPYITCTNDYIESVWWALKTFYDKGLVYKGFKIVPQCPALRNSALFARTRTRLQ